MLGVKGFDKDLTTSYGSDVKLEAGKTYKEDECKVYRNGWHFVEYAPDCLGYFPLGSGNRYFLVEAAGDINEEQDFRCCCTEITLLRELDLKAFAGMSMRYMIQNPKMEWQREAGHLQIKPEIALAIMYRYLPFFTFAPFSLTRMETSTLAILGSPIFKSSCLSLQVCNDGMRNR